MIYKTYYNSPLGKILLASENNKLIGLWFENQKYFLGSITEELVENNQEEILVKTKNWLDEYFKGNNPSIEYLALAPIGSAFAKTVWQVLKNIPYGTTTTYKNISLEVANILNKKSISCQAIGGAIGHNPISIIIPCHRVIASNGSLTGYAGGLDKKKKLLEHERKTKNER